MQKKIGLFGGTFNPIHFGHLNLAIELMEKWELDEVRFIPAYINPLKVVQLPAAAKHRLKMVQLALEDYANFSCNDLELRRQPPSYTIDTILEFKKQDEEEQNHFFWLMGEDTIQFFHHWLKPLEIIKHVQLLIGSRLAETPNELVFNDLEIEKAVKQGWTKTRIMQISSSELRSRLTANLYCAHLIPQKVLNYIKQNQLYQLNG